MELRTIPAGALAANCHILWTDPAAALVIDPGAEGERLVAAIRDLGVHPALVVNTHGHFDHTGAVMDVVRAFASAYRIHEDEIPIIQQVPAGTEMWGVTVADVPKPSAMLEDDEVLDMGGLEVKVIHTPGHTPGSTCFYVPEAGAVFTGDTLFQRSVGRSDFPGGNPTELEASIRQRLYTLPDETIVYPGHGPATSIGEEKVENPFVTA